MAPESLFSASDDSFIGRRAWRPPDGHPPSDLVAGKMPQDLHSTGLLVGPYQLTYSPISQTGLGSTLGKSDGG